MFKSCPRDDLDFGIFCIEDFIEVNIFNELPNKTNNYPENSTQTLCIFRTVLIQSFFEKNFKQSGLKGESPLFYTHLVLLGFLTRQIILNTSCE